MCTGLKSKGSGITEGKATRKGISVHMLYLVSIPFCMQVFRFGENDCVVIQGPSNGSSVVCVCAGSIAFVLTSMKKKQNQLTSFAACVHRSVLIEKEKFKSIIVDYCMLFELICLLVVMFYQWAWLRILRQ